jgi:hypothetical protein
MCWSGDYNFDPDRDPDGKIVQEFILETGATIQKSLAKE